MTNLLNGPISLRPLVLSGAVNVDLDATYVWLYYATYIGGGYVKTRRPSGPSVKCRQMPSNAVKCTHQNGHHLGAPSVKMGTTWRPKHIPQ